MSSNEHTEDLEGGIDSKDIVVLHSYDQQQDPSSNNAVVIAENDAFLGAETSNGSSGLLTHARSVMQWCETLAAIDEGNWMKTKTGTSGNNPTEDSFPWFSSSSTMQHVHLLWDLSPSEWRLVAFQNRPRDAYDPDEYLNAKLILLTDVTEVLLEVAPSTSFRIYLGESKQVVKFTPCPHDRDKAVQWVNAIYAAMYLQNAEEDDDVEEEGVGWFELREKYYELHPDQRPVVPDKEEYEAIAKEIENDKRKSFRLTSSSDAKDAENKSENLGGNNRQSKRLSISSMLDYTAIYGGADHSQEDPAKHQENACCVTA